MTSGYRPSTRNTRTERDGYGFALVALLGVFLMLALAAVLIVSLYRQASDAITHVTDCATQTISATTTTDCEAPR